MLKLLRNYFGLKNLYYDNKPIKWKLIEDLHRLQNDDHMNIGDKLTQRHIEWRTRKMKVRLAAQTMSRSVADAMDHLKFIGVKEFGDWEATTEFIRIIDSLCGIMNSKIGHEGKNYKTPICRETNRTIFEFFYACKIISAQNAN